jgi:hypothetical protein
MPGTESIWDEVLSHVKQDTAQDQQISPYFNISVLDAMTRLGHPRSALDWMRTYWRGMLAEGATSFWESYDLRWPKDTPHLSLQADGTSGFFVSLAHGWSSGPTAWLREQVLGVRNPSNGYRSVTFRPHLLGLAWARGSVHARRARQPLRSNPFVMKSGSQYAMFYFGYKYERPGRACELLALGNDPLHFHKVSDVLIDTGAPGPLTPLSRTSLHLSITRECCITSTARSPASIQTRFAASP